MKLCTLALVLAQWLHFAAAFDIWHLAGFDAPTRVAPELQRRDSNDSASSTSDDSKESKTKSSKTTSTLSIDPNLPAGGVSLKTPQSTSTTYVKAGGTVTFGWNYTSLIATPKALNIEAVCTQNKQTYTIAKNHSAKSTSVLWDTGDAEKDGALHLITAEYTLVIYDSESSPSAVASAGYLAPFQYTFGIYLPQKYKPWPQNAKYVNSAILTRPTILTTALVAVSSVLFLLL